MKRKIKFRVWDNELKRYFDPIYEAYKGNVLDLSISLSGELLRRTIEIPVEHESMFQGRYELEQFAGLTDKNGKEIYEGDVYSDKTSRKYEVVFNNGSFMKYNGQSYFLLTASEIKLWKGVIIGNIHENY